MPASVTGLHVSPLNLAHIIIPPSQLVACIGWVQQPQPTLDIQLHPKHATSVPVHIPQHTSFYSYPPPQFLFTSPSTPGSPCWWDEQASAHLHDLSHPRLPPSFLSCPCPAAAPAPQIAHVGGVDRPRIASYRLSQPQSAFPCPLSTLPLLPSSHHTW